MVFSCFLLWHVGSLVADPTRMWNPIDSAKQVCYNASSQVEESPFSLKGSAEVRMGFFLLQGGFFSFLFFSFCKRRPYFLSGASASFCIFFFILIISILLLFFYYYRTIILALKHLICILVKTFFHDNTILVWRSILLWPEEIDISAIVHCRRLLRRMCIAEGSLALDTPQNKSRSRLLFQANDKQTNNVEASSRIDWPQTLVSGYQFTFTYTTKSFVFLRSQKNEFLG